MMCSINASLRKHRMRTKYNNIAKANLLYNAIDNSKMFEGTANKEDRSRMNICFVMKEKYKDRLADYSIVDECLILDDSGRPQVKILVEPQMKDSDGSGALDDYYFPLQ